MDLKKKKIVILLKFWERATWNFGTESNELIRYYNINRFFLVALL